MKKTNFTLLLTLFSMVLCCFWVNNSNAQCPAGQTELTVDFLPAGFPNEVGWQLVEQGTGIIVNCESAGGAGPPTTQDFCAVGNSTYDVWGWDSFGDGWNGTAININLGGVLDLGTFSMASGGGAINPCPAFGPSASGTLLGNFTAPLIQCTVDCPADIVQSNDLGFCGANVNIPDPILGPDCTGAPAPPIASASGPAVPYNYNFTGLIATPVQILGATANATGPVSIDITFSGDHSFITEVTTLFGPDGSAVFQNQPTGFPDCQTVTETFTVAAGTWNSWVNTFGANLTFIWGPNPNVDTFCTNATVQLSASWPTGTVPFTHTIDGGPPIPGNASGFFPVGTTTVCYQSSDIFGIPSECCFTVTVNDDEPPELTCPNDILIPAGPGECGVAYSYPIPTATDNCPPASIAICINNDCSQVDNALACFAGPSSYIQKIPIPAGPNFMAESVTYAIWNGGFNATVKLYTLIDPLGPFVFSNFNTIASVTEAVPPGTLFFHTTAMPPGVVLPGGSIIVVDVRPDVGGFTLGVNTNVGASDDTWIASNICTYPGAPEPATFASIGFGFLDAVHTLNAFSEITVEQTDNSGLTSGDVFPIGVTCQQWTATDAIGNVSVCDWCVTVTEFPDAINYLVCNDLVQVTLNEDCEACVLADMILEGGPYGCYDEYIVRISNILGQVVAESDGVIGGQCALVDASFIGQDWIVEVIDPENGFVSCWGSLYVEDKLPPIVICEDISIACADEIVYGELMSASFTGNSGPRPPYDASTDDVEFNVTAPPVATVTGNVTVSLDISHTWVSDLDVFLIAPDGTQVELFTDQCGLSDDVDVTIDDAGAPFACSGTPVISGVLQPENYPGQALANVVGLGASGIWTVRVTDDAGGDPVNINNITLKLDWEGIFNLPEVIENCDVYELTFEDSFTDGACGGPSGTILRKWTATDAVGHTGFCTQIITLVRPTLDDVQLPGDIMWLCQQYLYWPNIIDPTELHEFITDSDPADEVINVNLDPLCDDNDLPWPQDPFFCFDQGEDDPDINSTNVANGGGGCPGNDCVVFPPNNGLDDADVLELTGSGRPEVNGRPIFTGDLCGINIDYTDTWFDVCCGTFKILRTWTLIDWCADPVDVREHLQVIKVVDIEGPHLATPNPPDLGLDIDVYDGDQNAQGPHQICTGHVVIPPAFSAGDVCCEIAGWTTELWTLGFNSTPADPVLGMLLQTIPTNGGIFWSVPLLEFGVNARYIVRYVNNDPCGNQTEGLMEITVIDRVPPVAICDEITEIAVTNNGPVGEGCSSLPAEDLDDGSYDNCKPVHFLLAKMDDSFSQDIFNRCYYPARDFCCDEVGTNVTVILLVLDGDPSPFFTTFASSTLGCDGTPGLFLTSGFTALNYNTCMVTVGVVDKLPPILVSCPGPTRITCDYFWDVLEVPLSLCEGDDDCEDAVFAAAGFGLPVFYDNCAVNITVTVNVNLNSCGEGTITRTWQAVDDVGNGPATCTQIIFVDHVSDWVIEFPEHLFVDCGNEVPDFGEPVITNETCELLAVSYEDTFFDVVADACYKIVRDWTAINWCVVGDFVDEEHVEDPESELCLPFPACDLDGDGDCDDRTFRDTWSCDHYPGPANATDQFDPDTDDDTDPWDGFIVYQQVIKVYDAVPPEFPDGCDIPDVCIEDNTCGATVLLPTPATQDCSPDVTVTVTSDLGVGFGPFFNVPPGTYNVTYVLMDNCGNSNACATTVTVLDCKLPTPLCDNGLVVEIDPPDPEVTVNAEAFDEGSWDNCTPASLLKFSYSSDVTDVNKTWFCDDIGQQNVQIWVTDLAGNQDFCETFIIIQDNLGVCGGDDPLQGYTETESDQGVNDVEVSVNSPSGFDNTVMTDDAGFFDFGMVKSGEDYTVTPVKDVNPLNGVSTFDLVLISKHILGVQSLDSPYKLIAADANNSGTVTTFDLVTIRKLILFIDSEFPNNTSWRFIPKDHVFGNPTNPWAGAGFPEVININNMTEPILDADFVAVKTGDVNGNAITNNLVSSDDRNFTGALTFSTDDAALKAGETHTVEFTAKDFNVTGYQFTLNFDRNALELVEVVPGLAQLENFGLVLVDEGAITTSWNSNEAKQLRADDVVFSLVVTAKTDAQLSDLLNINSRYTVAEAYNGTGELQDVSLEFNGTVAAAQFELLQNTPNPFEGATVIGFTLPEATAATLTITDVSGKVVKVIEGDFARGYNQVVVKQSELAGTGVLYYQLDTPTDTATKKMILID